MKVLLIPVASVMHMLHAFRHGLAKHRMVTLSIKPRDHFLHRTEEISCECGKVFYNNPYKERNNEPS